MAIIDYRNFDLLITRAGDHYRAFVVDAPAGEGSVLFDLPFPADEIPHLAGLARGVRRHVGAVDDAGPAANLVDLGSRLFEAIFRDKLRTLLAASLASVAEEGAGLRLRLRFEEDAAGLALLPWELLYDPDQRHFVGLGEQSPILRYLSLPRSRSALLVEPPLRVLAVLASPAGLAPLDMEREWQAMQDALAPLVSDGKFTLERLASPTLDALQQRLLGEPVHVLHFVGHGVFDEGAQAGSLALEDAAGRPHLARGEDLAKLLRNHPTLRLAYLNACEGALASGQSVFAGVAQALVQGGVPAAVAMQAEISDAGAVELARNFYTALAAGRPVDAALTQARVALSASGSDEWAVPVLFSRSSDNRLFDLRQVSSACASTPSWRSSAPRAAASRRWSRPASSLPCAERSASGPGSGRSRPCGRACSPWLRWPRRWAACLTRWPTAPSTGAPCWSWTSSRNSSPWPMPMRRKASSTRCKG